jgi:hypothetical protein
MAYQLHVVVAGWRGLLVLRKRWYAACYEHEQQLRALVWFMLRRLKTSLQQLQLCA